MLKRTMTRRAFTLGLMFVIASTPIFIVRSSPQERQFLKQPVFGNLNFAIELTLDSMMGGKYRTIDHPYVYMNTGRSVKCYEPESGRLAQTVPFDSNIEEPYSATNHGICFNKTDEKGARFFEIKRYDGAQTLLPMADNGFMVYWEPKPVVWQIERGNPEGANLIRAVDEKGQTVWKVDGVYDMPRDSSNRYWFKTKNGWFLVNPQTGKALATLPDGFGFVHSRGSLAYLLHESKVGVSGIFNIETGKLVHECKDSLHTIGEDGFLCFRKTIMGIHNRCYDFERYSKDGELVESFSLKMPDEFYDCCNFVINYFENHVIVAMNEDNTHRLIIINTANNKVDARIDLVNGCCVLDDGRLFYIGDRMIGCLDMNNFQQIWSMPIGNSYLGDDIFEKDFGNFKLVGRRILSLHSKNNVLLQVKIIDKTDNSVEPYEFEFENGGLRNCYETDYGFININDLSRFSIYYPQISFYRKGTVQAVGTIDYIGEIIENTISIEDGRYLTAKLKVGRTISIDAREMRVLYK